MNVLYHLRKVGITKIKGFSTSFIFVFLFSLIFKGKSIHSLVNGREEDKYMKKDTVYRFMNSPKYNWRLFLLNLSSFVISKIHSLTDSKEHLRLLVIDDSSYYRNRSTKVEQLSWQYDHAANRSFKGF